MLKRLVLTRVVATLVPGTASRVVFCFDDRGQTLLGFTPITKAALRGTAKVGQHGWFILGSGIGFNRLAAKVRRAHPHVSKIYVHRAISLE